MSIDDKLNKLDDAVTMAITEIKRLRDEIKRHELTLQKIAAEIECEADHYDAYVDADMAKGLYHALEIVQKYKDTDNVSDRDNRGMDRNNIDVEEVINVLDVLRMVTTGSETAKLDYAVECVEKVDRLHKWIEEVEHVAI